MSRWMNGAKLDSYTLLGACSLLEDDCPKTGQRTNSRKGHLRMADLRRF